MARSACPFRLPEVVLLVAAPSDQNSPRARACHRQSQSLSIIANSQTQPHPGISFIFVARQTSIATLKPRCIALARDVNQYPVSRLSTVREFTANRPNLLLSSVTTRRLLSLSLSSAQNLPAFRPSRSRSTGVPNPHTMALIACKTGISPATFAASTVC